MRLRLWTQALILIYMAISTRAAPTSTSANSATLRRALLRRRSASRRRDEADAFLDQVVTSICASGTPFGNFAKDIYDGSVKLTFDSNRNLVPLPICLLNSVPWPLECSAHQRETLLRLVNVSVAGINFLNASDAIACCSARASSAQRSSLSRLARKWWSVVCHIARKGDSVKHYVGAFGDLAKRNQPCSSSSLKAHQVDMLDTCAKLDVDDFVPDAFAATTNDPALLFVDGMGTLPSSAPLRGKRAEYVLLVRRQLRANKVALGRWAKHAAEVFTIHKKGSDKLREVWNGSALSQQAARPPTLPWLATPSSLTSLEASSDRKVWMSCRDGRVFFDQLCLPLALRRYFGKPGVTVQELQANTYTGDWHPGQHPLSDHELQTLLMVDDRGPVAPQDVLVPLSCCWPMGFAWSSCAAQYVMTDSVLAYSSWAMSIPCRHEGALPFL